MILLFLVIIQLSTNAIAQDNVDNAQKEPTFVMPPLETSKKGVKLTKKILKNQVLYERKEAGMMFVFICDIPDIKKLMCKKGSENVIGGSYEFSDIRANIGGAQLVETLNDYNRYDVEAYFDAKNQLDRSKPVTFYFLSITKF